METIGKAILNRAREGNEYSSAGLKMLRKCRTSG